MNSTAMKSIKYHSAVLMIKDIYMKMEKQVMHMVIRILNISLRFK